MPKSKKSKLTKALEHIAAKLLSETISSVTNPAERNSIVVQLKRDVVNSLRQAKERLVTFCKDQIDAKKNLEEIRNNLRHIDDYLTQSFRQRNIELLSDKELSSDESFETDAHVMALRQLSSKMTTELRLEGTTVLDNMIVQDVLSEAGRESILARTTNHGKNSAFMKFCSSLPEDSFIRYVLPSLKESNDVVNLHLARELENEIQRPKPFVKTQSGKVCKFCKIQRHVNLRRLADELHQSGAISEQLREDLSSPNIPNGAKWKELLEKVKKPNVLEKALKKKYSALHTIFPLDGLECKCDDGNSSTSTTEEIGFKDSEDIARLSDFSSDVSSNTVPKTTSQMQVLGAWCKTILSSLVWFRRDT